MTYTERYNEYVKEWIKENPALSSPYEPMLDFDEWVDKKLEEYKNIMEASESDKSFLEIDYTKESIPNKRYYVLTEDVPCWHWSRNDDDTFNWNIIGYNSKEVSPRKVIPEEDIQKPSDEFAIEFADWVINDLSNEIYDTKELLKIFKKEKGL